MDDFRPYPEKDYESLLKKRKKVKICVTISAENEIILYALTRYHKYDTYSRLINDALSEFCRKDAVVSEIEKAKDDWRKEWAAFRKQRIK